MRDPHVVSLTYKMESVTDESYDNPPPLEGEEASFSYRLENQMLQVSLKGHFATSDEARLAVEPSLGLGNLAPLLAMAKSESGSYSIVQRSLIANRGSQESRKSLTWKLGTL